ncbi:MAG: alpha/beta hydrolase [Acetobacteraceae bacterium]|nr:alpha/beta hydrolase [Acetobacteraceae bacterium]
MSVRTVHFATNRSYDPVRLRFGVKPEDGAAPLWSGFAACLAAPSPAVDGRLRSFDVARPEEPETGLRETIADWLGSAGNGEVPLLFVHGFNFGFEDALVRAADVAAWLEGGPGAPRLRPLVFTWPSNGLGTVAAYHDDQADAAAAPSLARLFRAIADAMPQENPARRPVLLAHSMGVFATRCGVQALKPPLPQRIFRHAFLMAGDDWTDVFASTGASASAGALRPLAAMAEAVTVGFNAADGVVWLVSEAINDGPRLGANGPMPRAELPTNVAAVDYSMAAAKPPPWVQQTIPNGESETNWQAHQYYRNNAAVRADMLAAIVAGGGAVAGRRKGRHDPAAGVKEDPACWYPPP